MSSTDFDLSDVAADSLHGVLGVAVEVLQDYGDDPGNTRIERLARFVIRTLGAGDTFPGDGRAARARALAASLLHYADEAEAEGDA